MESAKLNCAVNDADALAQKLQDLDFDVEVLRNTSYTDMGVGIASFKRNLCNYEVGLFFFAGHGFQFDGNNYLAMIDTSFVDEGSARYTSFPLNDAINAMESSDLAIKILVIDACRQGGIWRYKRYVKGVGTCICTERNINCVCHVSRTSR